MSFSLHRILALLLLVLCAAFVAGCGSSKPADEDFRRAREIFGATPSDHFVKTDVTIDVKASSFYVEMPDGVKIAVEVYLPEELEQGAKLPTIMRATRYWRRTDVLSFLRSFVEPPDVVERFVMSGYAVVDVDVRGTGASFGSRKHPFSSEEISDLGYVMDWIIERPWSDGNIGTMGISYAGTTAEFTAITERPALKAVMPKYSFYDAYADIGFPGGVFNEWMLKNWGAYNRSIDSGKIPEDLPWIVRKAARGVMPVVGEEENDETRAQGLAQLEKAVAEHAANLDVYEASRVLSFRDEFSSLGNAVYDDLSTASVGGRIDASGLPFYSWGGWFDGAYADSLLKRYRTQKNRQRAVIGPWNHAGVQDISPYRPQDADADPPKEVHHLEQIRFFDYYLKGEGKKPENILYYYTMGEECWKKTTNWPPEDTSPRVLHLNDDGGLSPKAPDGPSMSMETPLPTHLGTGSNNRWRTQILRSDVHYSQEFLLDGAMPVFTSEPLSEDMEINGNPVLTLTLSGNEDDGAIFVYLMDLDAEGNARYLSEGMLRFKHRKISQEEPPYVSDMPNHSYKVKDALEVVPGESMRLDVGLFAFSALVKKGSRLRLAISAADVDQFRNYWKAEPKVTIGFGEDESFLALPVTSRGSNSRCIAPGP
jgi:hypothetical protein